MDKCKPINHFVEENILYINPHMPYVEKKEAERERVDRKNPNLSKVCR